MNRKDLPFLGLLGGLILLLLAPALLSPERMLGNFGDIYFYHYPLRFLVASRLQEGSLPFWNPYIFSGLPLLANSQSSLFYPVSMLFQFFPVTYAFTLFTAFHLLWGTLGMYLWLRSCSRSRGEAALFAAAFGLSPFLIGRIPQGIPTHLAGLSYIPWCWMALRSRRAALLGAVWALQFFSGHPHFPFINLIAMGLYAAGDLKRRGADLLRGGALAAALCLVQLVPTALFLSASSRVDLPEFFFNAYSLPWRALATFLCPLIWGSPIRGDFASLPSVYFEEYTAYIGLVPLGLALAALVYRDRRKSKAMPPVYFGWGIAALGVGLAMGRENPALAWVSSLPVLSFSRTPARYVLLTVWGLLLAGAAGGALARLKPRLRAVLFFLALLDLGLWASMFIYTEDPAPYLSPKTAMTDVLGGQNLRFATDAGLANPNKAMLYRAMNVNGYDAYYLGRYASYAYRAEGKAAADPSRSYITRLDSPEMRRLGARYLLSSKKMKRRSIEVSGEMRLHEFPGALPLAHLRLGGRVWGLPSVDMESPERWTVWGHRPAEDAAADLVLGVPYFPGWRVWIDGREVPLRLYDGLTQAASLADVVPGGEFRAVFRFRPVGWLWLALASILAWALWLFSLSGAWGRFLASGSVRARGRRSGIRRSRAGP